MGAHCSDGVQRAQPGVGLLVQVIHVVRGHRGSQLAQRDALRVEYAVVGCPPRAAPCGCHRAQLVYRTALVLQPSSLMNFACSCAA